MMDAIGTESLHIAFVVVEGGVALVIAVVGWLLRRAIRQFDENQSAIAASLVRLEQRLESTERRFGYEIGDIKIAIAPLFTEAKLPPPNYPSR